MEKSLINPNQCQKFDIQLWYNPTDPQMKLGIESLEDLFIPMETEVWTCGVLTHPPTDNNLHDCQQTLLSDEFDWYPSNILFGISSKEKDYRTSSNLSTIIFSSTHRLFGDSVTCLLIKWAWGHLRRNGHWRTDPLIKSNQNKIK